MDAIFGGFIGGVYICVKYTQNESRRCYYSQIPDALLT